MSVLMEKLPDLTLNPKLNIALIPIRRMYPKPTMIGDVVLILVPNPIRNPSLVLALNTITVCADSDTRTQHDYAYDY